MGREGSRMTGILRLDFKYTYGKLSKVQSGRMGQAPGRFELGSRPRRWR